MIKKVVFIVGHRELSQGAKNYLGQTEYSFNKMIANQIVNLSCFEDDKEWDVRGCFRSGDSSSISMIGEEVAEFDPHISIELHFNSFHKPITGNVVEALALSNAGDIGSEISYKDVSLADTFMNNMHNKFNFGLRSIIPVARGDRGYINLESIRKCNKNVSSILVEPVFGNFETKESAIFFASQDEYVEVLVKTVKDWFNKFYGYKEK